MCLNGSFVFSQIFTYSGTCIKCSNHFITFGDLITSSLTKYSGHNYGCTFLVPSRLTRLPMGSSLSDCSFYWLKLIANGHHEYHDEYCWPNTFSFAHNGLMSSNLQHSHCWVFVQLGTHTLQLIHGLCDNILSCFSFLKLILIWMYYVQLTYCPHKYMRDWIWNTHHPKLIS